MDIADGKMVAYTMQQPGCLLHIHDRTVWLYMHFNPAFAAYFGTPDGHVHTFLYSKHPSHFSIQQIYLKCP